VTDCNNAWWKPEIMTDYVQELCHMFWRFCSPSLEVSIKYYA